VIEPTTALGYNRSSLIIAAPTAFIKDSLIPSLPIWTVSRPLALHLIHLPQLQDKDAEPPDVISIHSSASSSRQPSRPPIRNTNTKPSAKPKRQRLLMEYVLVPLPPSRVRKSNRIPVEQTSSMPKRLATAKGKARVGDNSGPTALAAALQGAFENNASSTVSVQTSGARRRKEVQEGSDARGIRGGG